MSALFWSPGYAAPAEGMHQLSNYFHLGSAETQRCLLQNNVHRMVGQYGTVHLFPR